MIPQPESTPLGCRVMYFLYIPHSPAGIQFSTIVLVLRALTLMGKVLTMNCCQNRNILQLNHPRIFGTSSQRVEVSYLFLKT